MEYGIISLLPITVVIAVAIKTKRVVEPLLMGCFVGFILLNGFGVLEGILNGVYTVFKSDEFSWIVMVTILFGALVEVLERTGAAVKFADIIGKKVKNQRSSLMITWIIGMILFIDDFLNALAVGATMRNVTDKHKVPREMLAYTVDVTAAPMAVLLPFSAWSAFFMSLFADVGLTKTLNISEFDIYVKTIPFIFYGFVALLLVPLLIYNTIPYYGTMKKAWKRVAETGNVFPENNNIERIDMGNKHYNSKLRHFVVPIVVLIGATLLLERNLIKGVIIALAVIMVMLLVDGVMNLQEFMSTVGDGIRNMVQVVGIMLLSLVLLEANDGLGTTKYIIDVVSPWLNGGFLPAVTFIVVCFMSFSTGSFWGTSALMMPIVVPLAMTTGAHLYLTLGAIISGAIFGSNCCFFADATVLTSKSCEISPIDHAVSQLPYGLISAGISFVLYLGLGFIL